MEEEPNKPSSKAYDVGYRKPPKAFSFQKGRSGNPTGKNKQKPDSFAVELRAQLQAALNGKMQLGEGEQKRFITNAAAGINRLVEQFANGDHRARRDLILLAEKLGVDLTAGQRDSLQKTFAAELSKNDQELVDHFLEHRLAEREAQQRQQRQDADRSPQTEVKPEE